MAILEDNKSIHGPLECLFTVDEETGMTGATNLKAGFLKGKYCLTWIQKMKDSFLSDVPEESTPSPGLD